MSDLDLRALAANEQSDWPKQLVEAATFTALDGWLNVAHAVYGFPIYRLETRRAGQVTGILALAHVRHPIFGSSLMTSPFGSYGGFAFTDLPSHNRLLDEARDLGTKLNVSSVNIRFDAHDQSPPEGWVQHPIYSTYLLDLPQAPETLLANFSSDHRNHIRKSLKKGFAIRFGRLELLDDAYDALARSMHELGSPFHSKRYLKTMAESLGERLELAVLSDRTGKIAGVGVLVLQGSVVASVYANILRGFRSDYAGEFLYWQLIERYALGGFKILDLGRSLIGSGNETFKMKWKPRPRRLAYWYALRPAANLPALHPKNPRFAAAIWTWKRLPSFVIRPLGPLLISGLA
jgi:FemAB-related protein (PEP-CTERM system-associated)